MLTPFFVFSAEYQDTGGAFQMISDYFQTFQDLVFNDVPNMLQRFTAYVIELAVKVKLAIQLAAIEFAWGVAKQMLLNIGIMSEITAQVGALNQDVKQALVDMRLFDGLNIVLTAHMTRYVLGLV
jgi:hypothetical protein